LIPNQLEIPMFGMTKCGKCEGGSFKIQEISPNGSAYKFYAVQCMGCQTPIGITEYYSVGQMVKNQEKEIADLGSKLDGMAHTIDQMAHAINQMGRR
jgi:hypothetical protein